MGTVIAGAINWVIFLVILFALVSYALFFAVAYKAKRATREELLSRKEWQAVRPEAEEALAWYDGQTPQQLYILTRDQVRLSGFYLPAEGESRGRVVLMHDYRTNPEASMAAAVRLYHESGFDVLLCHERSHGESLGKYICFGSRERFDCKLWVECMNKLYGADKPTVLHGVGMGGTAVLMTAGLKLTRNVCCIVADSAFTSPYAVVKKLLRRRHMSANLAFFDFWCKALAGYKLKGAATQEALRRTKLPVLLLHGEADELAPAAMARANYEACGGERKLILVPGAGHGTAFLAAGKNGMIELADFAEQHLELPERPAEEPDAADGETDGETDGGTDAGEAKDREEP